MKLLNLKLMANPLNWITLAIWFTAGALILSGSGILTTPANSNTGGSSG